MAFALGVNTDLCATILMTGTRSLPFFSIGMGMIPTTLGIILMIYRARDAMANPVVGRLSDNTVTRWSNGRCDAQLARLSHRQSAAGANQAQSPEMLSRMFFILIATPIIVWTFALLLIWCHPLDRKHMGKIRADLETRREKL